jgi:hypothetical protein
MPSLFQRYLQEMLAQGDPGDPVTDVNDRRNDGLPVHRASSAEELRRYQAGATGRNMSPFPSAADRSLTMADSQARRPLTAEDLAGLPPADLAYTLGAGPGAINLARMQDENAAAEEADARRQGGRIIRIEDPDHVDPLDFRPAQVGPRVPTVMSPEQFTAATRTLDPDAARVQKAEKIDAFVQKNGLPAELLTREGPISDIDAMQLISDQLHARRARLGDKSAWFSALSTDGI